MLKNFRHDRSGNFAIISAIVALPLILTVGFAIDGSRYYSARAHLQDAADTAALAVAASKEQDVTKLREQAESFVSGNLSIQSLENVTIASFSADLEKIDMQMNGVVPTTFMRLANYETMPIAATVRAMRAPERKVEIALVLDNTFSMSEVDSKGVSRLTSLKAAAGDLVTSLLGDADGPFKIALVPYADYVNVGPQYRNAAWISVPADKEVPGKACTTKTETYCSKRAPGAKASYDCSTTTDGVYRPKTCYTENACVEEKTREVCTGATAAYTETFFGCIRSRTGTNTHLSDGNPSVKYVGMIGKTRKCHNSIVQLTNDKTVVSQAVTAMAFSGSGYEPLTYIPAGMMWGVNVLSPTEPFSEGDEYDLANKAPQKVLILMTDGDNTLARNTDGTHTAPSAATAVTKLNQTDADTLALCTYAKSKKIEVYTVAFMVDSVAGKNLLEKCATDKSRYYDATNSAKLSEAFAGIARSMSQVRLAY